MWRIVFMLALVFISIGHVRAENSLAADLQKRLDASDVASVNSYLVANWETKMASLGRLIRSCDTDALKIGVQLINTTNLEALQGHVYALELAMAACPLKLLPLVPIEKIPSVCAVDAFSESHPKSNPAKEIGRRIKFINSHGQLRNSPNGRACLQAYKAARREMN